MRQILCKQKKETITMQTELVCFLLIYFGFDFLPLNGVSIHPVQGPPQWAYNPGDRQCLPFYLSYSVLKIYFFIRSVKPL